MNNQEKFQQIAEAAQQTAFSTAQGVRQVIVVFTLWGTSYTLQDVASIVSILAGLVGLVYTLHLLIKFYWDNFWRKAPSRITKETPGVSDG